VEKQVLIFNGFGLLSAAFYTNLVTIRFFQKTKCAHHSRATDATFVTNLTFLGPLNPEISFGEKKNSHPLSLFRHP